MRKLLDKIIHKNRGDNWWKPELFKKYTLVCLPKELEVLKAPLCYSKNHNCFIYALGLSDNKKIIKDSGGFIYDTLFQKWIDEGLLKHTNNPKKGDYIIYRDLKKYPDTITHIGVLNTDKDVMSKWAWGPLFKHKKLDVPESYGDNISYVKAISKYRAKELYWKDKKFNIKLK